MKKVLPGVLVLFCAAGCKYNIRDNYIPFPGKVTIVEIKDSLYNPTGKNSYSDIYMDFVPDDATAPSRYRFKKWKDTHVQLSHRSRMNHYKPWIQTAGIKKGNVYKAIRYEKNAFGSSAPVIFKVDLQKQLK